jgi:Zn ribbon nucleic-acid-binding protein
MVKMMLPKPNKVNGRCIRCNKTDKRGFWEKRTVYDTINKRFVTGELCPKCNNGAYMGSCETCWSLVHDNDLLNDYICQHEAGMQIVCPICYAIKERVALQATEGGVAEMLARN